MSGDGRRREGSDPSRYLGSRAVVSQPSTSEEVIITQQPTQTKVRPRPGHHLEIRPAEHGDDLDQGWEIVDEVDSTEGSAMKKVCYNRDDGSRCGLLYYTV